MKKKRELKKSNARKIKHRAKKNEELRLMEDPDYLEEIKYEKESARKSIYNKTFRDK